MQWLWQGIIGLGMISMVSIASAETAKTMDTLPLPSASSSASSSAMASTPESVMSFKASLPQVVRLPDVFNENHNSGGKEELTLGILLSMSGSQSLIGRDVLSGFTTAIDYLNTDNQQQNIRIIPVAVGESVKNAHDGAMILVNIPNIDVFITAVASPVSLRAALPVLEKSGKIILNLSPADNQTTTQDCSSRRFDIAPPFLANAQITATLMKEQNIDNVVLIIPDTELGDSIAINFQTIHAGSVYVMRIPVGQGIFHDELDLIRERSPDAIYSALHGGTGVLFVRAFENTDLTAHTPLFLTWELMEPPFLGGLGIKTSGVVSITPWNHDLKYADNIKFVADYEKYIGRRASSWSALGYDALIILNTALKETKGNMKPDILANSLRMNSAPSVRDDTPLLFAANHTPITPFYLRTADPNLQGRFNSNTVSRLSKKWQDPDASACSFTKKKR